MEKNLKIQKILSLVQTLVLIGVLLFALGFMTAYKDLSGFVTQANKSISDFHDVKMQGFNRFIILFALLSACGIFAMKALEIRRKICDKPALIIMGVFSLLALILSVYIIIGIPGLKNAYLNVDFSKIYIEDALVDEDFVYVHKMFTLNLGIFVGIISLISTAGFMFTLIFNHQKYLTMVEGEANE